MSFSWALFEAWISDGAVSKEKWAFAAMGHLGGDECCLKKLPHSFVNGLEKSQHQRAVSWLIRF